VQLIKIDLPIRSKR